MTQYSYKARNNTGGLVAGQITGDSPQDVINQLRQKQYTPIAISHHNPPEVKKNLLLCYLGIWRSVLLE